MEKQNVNYTPQRIAIQQNVDSGLFRFLVSAAKIFCFLSSLWLIFYFINTRLPYIRPGHTVIYSAKTENLRPWVRFDKGAEYKVVIFGDSKVLSGFAPDVFDSTNDRTCSYNLALPQEEHFLFVLDSLIENNQIPTHVFLTSGWSDKKDTKDDNSLAEDRAIMETLFPFRKLPRNLTLFLIRARSHGGVTEYYNHAKKSVELMLRNRGYYFIEGQSHFPGNRLPEDFKLQGDKPDFVNIRNFDTNNSTLERLKKLHERHNINFCIVPGYYRDGSYAKCPGQSENAETFKEYRGIVMLGPEYYLLDNKYFSDPIHANPEGAELYTRKISRLFKEHTGSPEK